MMRNSNLNSVSTENQHEILNKFGKCLLTNKVDGKCLAKSSLIRKMGGSNAMKHMLGLDTDPLQSERSKTAARKLTQIIPTDIEMDNISMQDLSRVIIDVEHEVRDVEQNTDIDMREIIG